MFLAKPESSSVADISCQPGLKKFIKVPGSRLTSAGQKVGIDIERNPMLACPRLWLIALTEPLVIWDFQSLLFNMLVRYEFNLICVFQSIISPRIQFKYPHAYPVQWRLLLLKHCQQRCFNYPYMGLCSIL